MKPSFKKISLTALSGIMLASTVMPAFAQNYTQNYKSSQTTKPNYNYQQPAQNYNYQPPQNYNYQPPAQNNYSLPPLQGRVVIVPPGTMITGATVSRQISSEYARTGDTVSMIMNTPFYYGNTMVLPAGSNIQGTIVLAEKAGFTGKNGQLMIVFNSATTPNGQRIPLSGKIATEDGTGVIKGGTATDRATKAVKNAAVGSGLGALAGLIFGAASGGKAGKGAAIGTAIGGGTGLLKSAADKGSNVVIGPGDRVDIILDSELRAGADSSNNQNTNPYW
jgi:hypothetical protein